MVGALFPDSRTGELSVSEGRQSRRAVRGWAKGVSGYGVIGGSDQRKQG